MQVSKFKNQKEPVQTAVVNCDLDNSDMKIVKNRQNVAPTRNTCLIDKLRHIPYT